MPPLNLALVALLALTQLLQFILLPAVLLPRDAAWGALLLPLAPLSLTLWALIHECVHGSLGASARTTQRIGRGLSVLFGAPYRVLRLGHLLHHKHNRQPGEATEVYDDRHGGACSRGLRGWLHAAPRYYAQVLGGLYLLEAAAGWLAWLPRRVLRRWAQRAAAPYASDTATAGPPDAPEMPQAATARSPAWATTPLQAPSTPRARLLDSLTMPEALRELRLDGAVIAALWAASAGLYGRHAWMLAAALAARALLVSLHDNVYHYGTALAPAPGSASQAPASRTLRLPRWMSATLLHFNYHDTHHRHPRLGWRELPRAWAAEQARRDALAAAEHTTGAASAARRYPPDTAWAVALLAQLRGPLPASRLMRLPPT